MHAVSGKEDPAQEQGECNNEHLYEELTLAGFFSSRCNDDLWEMPAEGSGCAERNTTLELHHTAAQRAYGGPSPLDRAQQSSPVTSLPCYKFAGFEYVGCFPMIFKEVEEVLVDCLKSKVFPAVVRKRGRQVVLLVDSNTVQVQPALDGSHSNDVLATLLLRKLICMAPDTSTGQDLFAMVVKGSAMKSVTAHVFRTANSEKVTELCRRVELLLREARPQSVGTAASTSSSGASSHTSALAFLPSKDAPLSRHKAFTSMKAKQSSSPARTRMASLPCEPQKYQLNLEKDTCNTMCSAKPKSGSVHQGRCPPPVPPRKSIPEIVKEIKQVKQEIEQLTAETEGSSTLEAKSDHLTPLPTAMKVEGLSKKQDSLLGLQRLLIATCETQQEMAGVKECFGESWFRPQWERQVAEEVLLRLPPGSFLVRESRTHAHSFALSMKDPSCAIVHHLILKGSTGYHLKGVEHASYKQLLDLIYHLSRKQEVLPCTLTLSTPIGATDNTHQGGGESEYVVPDKA